MSDLYAQLASIKQLYAKLFGPMITYPLEKNLWKTRVSQAFGVRNPHYRSGIHNGVDHAVPVGTPIIAPVDKFEVYETFRNHKTMGNAAYCYFTYERKQYWMRILHLREAPAKGLYEACDVVAYSGNTGDSTGPHTHIELWEVPINTRLLYTKSNVLLSLVDPVAWFNARVL